MLFYLLSTGYAYQYVSADFIHSFPLMFRKQIVSVYADSLKLVRQISNAFSALSYLLLFLEKPIKLRTELNTEYVLSGKTKESQLESDSTLKDSDQLRSSPSSAQPF